MKQTSNLSIILNMYNCRHIRQYMTIVMDMCKVSGAVCRFGGTYRLLQLLCTHTSLYSYTNELVTILHAEKNGMGCKIVLYSCALPKRAGLCVLKHCCHFNDVCAFFDHIVTIS